jgi:hypothetical protein
MNVYCHFTDCDYNEDGVCTQLYITLDDRGVCVDRAIGLERAVDIAARAILAQTQDKEEPNDD